ncbi:MAG TPA: P1 family peptidase [Vicinamibacterales bacterium]|nr:P1 family peptidase [Vicinamibacterales bacterium]
MMRRAILTAGLVAVLTAAGSAASGWATQTAGALPQNKTITAVPGIKIGHFTLSERPTGCTVVLVDGAGAVGGVSQRGGAPGTRETDLLRSENMVDSVNAIVLAGGSAFGLDAASGTVKWLAEHNIGWPAGPARVPIVPAAILFDLGVGGDASIRPNADCGYRAAASASTAAAAEGSVGAGAGATVGKFGGGGRSMKAGIGSAALALPNGLVVSAIVAVNAVGDIVDPTTGRVVAGVRNADGSLGSARSLLLSGGNSRAPGPGQNTTIGVVATNARLTKAEANRLALMADDGYARAIYPSHTEGDGDTVFSLATGRWDGSASISTIGALAAEAMAQAVVRAATEATGVAGIPAARDLRR